MTTPRRHRRLWTDTRERFTRSAWPTRTPCGTTEPRVAVVTVSYNTRDLIAHLLFSLHRVLPVGSVAEVVVVDNGSTDGSLELLGGLAAAGLIRLVRNDGPPYHGPGLNRGLSFLAREPRPVDLVWVLDSDAVVLASNALQRCLDALLAQRAAIVGQQQPYDQPRPALDRYAHPAALLLDPAKVWRHTVPAFLEDGAPGVMMQHVLRRRGETIIDLPVFADGLLLHLGSGTLRVLADRDHRDNRYYEWAGEHRDHHFHGRADGAHLYRRFLDDFELAVRDVNAAALLSACRDPGRLSWRP